MGSALTIACRQGRESIVEKMLATDQPIESYRGVGSALEVACAEGHEGTVNLLLARGAKGGEDDLRAACAGGNEGTVDILLSRGAISSDDALRAACAGSDERISRILRESPGSDTLGADCAEDQGRILRKLLARGAKADRLAFPSALEDACCGGYLGTVKALLKNDCGLAFLW